jgi:hypothetical protein
MHSAFLRLALLVAAFGALPEQGSAAPVPFEPLSGKFTLPLLAYKI